MSPVFHMLQQPSAIEMLHNVQNLAKWGVPYLYFGYWYFYYRRWAQPFVNDGNLVITKGN